MCERKRERERKRLFNMDGIRVLNAMQIILSEINVSSIIHLSLGEIVSVSLIFNDIILLPAMGK